MKRLWKAARSKVEAEGCCRVCSGMGYGRDDSICGPLEAAHIIPRSRIGIRGGKGEDARNIVPLCQGDHYLYDCGQLDLRPFLSADEVAYAVELVGAAEAERRLMGSRAWRLSSRLVGGEEAA